VSVSLASVRTSLRQREDIHVLAALTAVTAWGIGPILNKSMTVSSSTIVFYRILIGAPLMTVMAYLNGGRITKELLRKSSVPGLLFGASMIAGFAAFQHTSIANSTLVTTLQPVLVMFVAPKMFGEKLTARKVFYSVTAMSGVLIVVLAAASTSGAHISGDLLAVANVVIWTAYFVMAKVRRLDGVHSWAFLATVFMWAAVVALPFGLVTSNDLTAMTTKDWVLIVTMALIPGVVGHGMMTWSQSHLDVSLASLLGLLSPVISAILAWLILHQTLTPMQLVGGLVVLVSMGLLLRVQNT
jgi:drug/metabolite transporter (DMT)-like permease